MGAQGTRLGKGSTRGEWVGGRVCLYEELLPKLINFPMLLLDGIQISRHSRSQYQLRTASMIKASVMRGFFPVVLWGNVVFSRVQV